MTEAQGEPLRRGPNSHVDANGWPKARYSSRKAAKAAARRLWSMYSRSMHEYACSECGGWHLSKSPRRIPDA